MRSSDPSARDWEKDRSRLNHDGLKNQLKTELLYIIGVLRTGDEDGGRLGEFPTSWQRRWTSWRAELADVMGRFADEASPERRFDFAPYDELDQEERDWMKAEARELWRNHLAQSQPIERMRGLERAADAAWLRLKDEMAALRNYRDARGRRRVLAAAEALHGRLENLGDHISALGRSPNFS